MITRITNNKWEHNVFPKVDNEGNLLEEMIAESWINGETFIQISKMNDIYWHLSVSNMKTAQYKEATIYHPTKAYEVALNVVIDIMESLPLE